MKIDLFDKKLEAVFDLGQYCKDNNIDAEGVTSLDCGSNKLIELDVSKLVNLRELYCYDNNLTEIKGLDKLVNLEILDYSDNKITELDLSKLDNLWVLNGAKYIKQ